MEATRAKVVGPADGRAGFLGSIGVRFMIDGEETDQGFSLVEHGGALKAEPQALADLCARYELDLDPETVPGLLERFDLRLGEPIGA